MNDAADPIQDQYRAAEADAEAEFLQTDPTKYEQAQPGEVVRRVMSEFLDACIGDKGRVCPHSHNRGPHVIYGAACNPGIVGCQECVNKLRDARRAPEVIDNEGLTCDGCKEKARWGKSGVLQHGPLILEIALCDFCCTLDEGSAERNSNGG